jgi:hypothetical protein
MPAFVPKYTLSILHTSPDAGLLLTAEMERRFREYYNDTSVEVVDAATKKTINPGWSSVQSPQDFIDIRVLKRPQLSRSKVPAVEFTMYIAAPPLVCVQFFQDIKEQQQTTVNAKIEELIHISRIVKNQQPHQTQQQLPLNLADDWYTAYKNVSFIYTRHRSMAPSLGMPPVDAVNIMAVRKFTEGKIKGSWLIMSMCAHADNFKARDGYIRAENYIAFSLIEPFVSDDGSIITKLRVVECLTMDGYTPKDIITAQIPNEVERFYTSVARIVEIQESLAAADDDVC